MGTRPKQTFFQRKYTNGLQAHEKMLNITNLQNIQAAHAAQYQKNKQPDPKMGRRPK